MNYMYNNMLLSTYCKENKIDYNYIKEKLSSFSLRFEHKLPLDVQISLAIEMYKKRRKKYKYRNIKYKNTILFDYCKKNNIDYKKIAKRIYYSNKNNTYNDLDIEQKIDIFILKFQEKKLIDNLKIVFKELSFETSLKSYKGICYSLNLDYNKLNRRKNKNIKDLIFFSYFCGDKYSPNGKYISNQKYDQIITKQDININDCVALYKTNKNAYLKIILEHQKYYLIGLVLRVIREHNFYVKVWHYEDLFSEAKKIFISCLNNIVLFETGRIIRYIEKVVTKRILTYLINNYSYNHYLLNENYQIKKEVKEKWIY